eukprot:6190800-Pleurochrysis_carterae.AAC.1
MTVLMNGSSRAFCGASSLLASLRTHAQAPMRMMHAAAAPMGGVRLPRTPTKLASVASIRQSKHAECISLLTTPPFHTPSRGVAKVPRRRAPVAWAKRAPFQQKNKLRDNYFVQRCGHVSLHAYISFLATFTHGMRLNIYQCLLSKFGLCTEACVRPCCILCAAIHRCPSELHNHCSA